MKKTLTILAIIISVNSFANLIPQSTATLYNHLVSVNPEWKNYIQETGIYTKKISFVCEDELLQQHFKSVIAYLKKNEPENLNRVQRKNRKKLLHTLTNYWKAKKFPLNYDYALEKKPCFIDEDGGVCAVGQLLVESGEKELAYTIAKEMKYFFVREMNNNELIKWQKTCGFTIDELALIQPSYSYSKKNAQLFTLGYQSNFLGINTSIQKNTNPYYSYQHQYSWGINLMASYFPQKKLGVSIGIGFNSVNYSTAIESNFTPNVYGMIKRDLTMDYISIPLYFTRLDLNRKIAAFRVGLVSNFNTFISNKYVYFGSADANIAANYQLDKKKVNRYLPQLYCGYFYELKLIKLKANFLYLHIEPNISLNLRNDYKISTVTSYKPIMLGLNTGISLVDINSGRGRGGF